MATREEGRSSAWQVVESVLRELSHVLRLLYRLFRDPRVSGVDKALLLASISYVITPLDLIPDVLGMAGRLDDLYLVGLVLDRLLVRAGPDVLVQHWSGRPETLRLLLDGLDQVASLVPEPVRELLRGRVDAPSDEG